MRQGSGKIANPGRGCENVARKEPTLQIFTDRGRVKRRLDRKLRRSGRYSVFEKSKKTKELPEKRVTRHAVTTLRSKKSVICWETGVVAKWRQKHGTKASPNEGVTHLEG